MAYEFFYSGTPYSLEPTYGEFIGYRIPVSELGAPTSIQTANQLQEVSNLLNQGIKTIELQPLSPEVFDQIPKQHFKEIKRLQKLAGGETTVHAPMIEPSGLTKEGWSETDREIAERQLKMVADKSHDLNPEGNIPITVHASAIPGAEFTPVSREMKEKYRRQFREQAGREPIPEEMKLLAEKRLVAINQETKQLLGIEREEKYYPETGRELRVPRKEIEVYNNTDWINSVTNLAFYKKEADELLAPAYSKVSKILTKGMPDEKQYQENKGSFDNMQRAGLFLENVEATFRTLYNKAYKYGDEETKERLKNIAKLWREKNESMKQDKNVFNRVITQSNLIDNTLELLQTVKPPKVYKPIEDFAREHSAQTFANVALHAYEEYGDKAPIISVENLYPGMAFSRSEQMRRLIDEAREKFIIEAVKKGHSKGKAEEAAKKMIGVTWDIGHLNMLRKEGFKEEEIIAETQRIAPYVKHVHLTDNFGYSDSHLPPGMGNVPAKEILQELEKKGFKGKKIVEAGGFVQHFKISPTQAVLEAFGSPLYAMMAAPYWNQARMAQGDYFMGYGPILPEQHFSMYGAGFSGMPAELGGQMPGKQSRFSGTPTE